MPPGARMDAMIFAAGLGTRLRPLTNERPKALVEVGGTPILEIVARRLIAAGADRIVINTHWFGEQVAQFVREREGFGVEVFISHEPDAPLDTGGGLAQARTHFRAGAPVLLHNCDVVSDIDLRALYAAHTSGDDALATLAVLPPSPERYLVFDDVGLCGYGPRGGGAEVLMREVQGSVHRSDFTGIHVVSPALLDTLGAGSYSIMDHYLKLASGGASIRPLLQPHAQWIDIGTHEKLAAAEELLTQ